MARAAAARFTLNGIERTPLRSLADDDDDDDGFSIGLEGALRVGRWKGAIFRLSFPPGAEKMVRDVMLLAHCVQPGRLSGRWAGGGRRRGEGYP